MPGSTKGLVGENKRKEEQALRSSEEQQPQQSADQPGVGLLDGLASDEDDQEREQTAFEPVGGDEPEAAVHRHQRDRRQTRGG